MAFELLFNRSAVLLETMIEKPLIYTYLHGGTLFGIGGHGGRPETEICSMLTDVPSKHWEQHQTECDDLINTKIRSFEVLCAFAAYMSILGLMVWKCSTRAMSMAETIGAVVLTKTWSCIAHVGGAASNFFVSAWEGRLTKKTSISMFSHSNVPTRSKKMHQDPKEDTIVLSD
jgi:hypothetical protein